MNKSIAWALVGLGSAAAGNLLDRFDPALRPLAEVPSWLAGLQAESARLSDVDAAWEGYLKLKYPVKPAWANQTDEWAQGMEPWYRAYKSWKKSVKWAVGSDGVVRDRDLALAGSSATSYAPPAGIAGVGTGPWTAMGPMQVFWPAQEDAAQRACPWHMNIYKVRMAPSDANVVYALGETGHFYRTVDKGLNWTTPSPDYPTRKGALAVDPSNPSVVLIGGDDVIQRSSDGGATWSVVYRLSNMEPNEIWFSPSGNSVLAATAKGMMRSTDKGLTWTSVNQLLCYDVAYNPLNSQIAYGACRNGATLQFLKSTNGGQSFVAKTSGFDNSTPNEGAVLGISPADTSKIYLTFLSSGATGIKLLRSTNGGESWSQGAGPTSNPGDLSSFLNWQGFYNLALAVDPNNANNVITGTANAHRSSDGGLSFPVTIGGFGGDIFPIHPDFQDIDSRGGDTWIATDGGLSYSTDFFATSQGAQSRMRGIIGSDFWHFDQGWDQDIVIGGRYHNGNVFMSENYPAGDALRYGGAESATGWVLHGLENAVITDDAGNYFMPSTKSGTMTSFDYRKYPGGDGYGAESSELLIDPDLYSHHYVGNGNELWESWDGGLSFNSLKNFGGAMRKMEISRPDGQVLYVAVQGLGSLQRSADAGQTWVARNLPGGADGNSVDFSINPENPNELWLVNRNGPDGSKVWRTLDGGSTWSNQTTSALNGMDMWMVHYIGGAIYITAKKSVSIDGLGTRQAKVFYRAAGGAQWTDYSGGLPQAGFDLNRSLPFFRDAKLRMSSNHGIWQAPLVDPNFKPVAQPSLSKSSTDCARDSVELYDYSISHGTKSRVWRISPAPQGISDSTALRPKVVFGKTGAFDVSLEVVDAAGQKSTQTLAKAFNIDQNLCGDIVPSGGSSVQLSGSNPLATLPALSQQTNQLTLTAWFKINQPQNVFTGLMMMRGGGNVGGIIFKENNTLGFDLGDQYYSMSNATQIPLGQWNHVAMVVQPDSVKLYLNGFLIQSVAGNIAQTNFSAPWTLGRDPNGSADRIMTGLIDEVQIFNRPLTQTEIYRRKDMAAQRGEKGLLHYYQFNEASGGVLYDAVGSAHGSLSGTGRSPEGAPITGQIVAVHPLLAQNVRLGTVDVHVRKLDGRSTLEWTSGGNDELNLSLFDMDGRRIDQIRRKGSGEWVLPPSQGQSRVLRLQNSKNLRFMIIAP